MGGSGDVQGLGSGRLAAGIGGDLVDPRLGLTQQLLAPPLQGLAPLIDRDGLFQRNLAIFQALDDRFELFDRALEGQALHIGVGVFNHVSFERYFGVDLSRGPSLAAIAEAMWPFRCTSRASAR